MWRALALGCIPVTFFRAAELPFARRLGLDYSQFVVNVQPDDYRSLQARCSPASRDPSLRKHVEGTLIFPLTLPQLEGGAAPYSMLATAWLCARSFLARLGQCQGGKQASLLLACTC